jgi:hypothetical protein
MMMLTGDGKRATRNGRGTGDATAIMKMKKETTKRKRIFHSFAGRKRKRTHQRGTGASHRERRGSKGYYSSVHPFAHWLIIQDPVEQRRTIRAWVMTMMMRIVMLFMGMRWAVWGCRGWE